MYERKLYGWEAYTQQARRCRGVGKLVLSPQAVLDVFGRTGVYAFRNRIEIPPDTRMTRAWYDPNRERFHCVLERPIDPYAKPDSHPGFMELVDGQEPPEDTFQIARHNLLFLTDEQLMLLLKDPELGCLLRRLVERILTLKGESQ